MASRAKHRQRNKLTSIHDPPDPSPRQLPDGARAEWEAAYEEAYDVYRKKDLAERAAWREVRLRWQQTGKKTWQRCRNGVCYWPAGGRLPMPKKHLVPLGVLVEYVYIDKTGELQVKEFNRDHPPILWWDEGRKMLYAFPKNPYPTECQPIPDSMWEAFELFRIWHQRDPKCRISVPVPDVQMKAVGAADSLSYASDKWNEDNPDPALRDAQEYIHNHWYDVWVWTNTTRGVPDAIVITGGELDLHPRGLIH